MAQTKCKCLHHREGTPRGKNGKSWLCRWAACENMVAMLKHQHLRKSEMGKATERIKWLLKVDPKGRDLEKAFMEDWVFIIKNPSEAPHKATMKRENELGNHFLPRSKTLSACNRIRKPAFRSMWISQGWQRRNSMDSGANESSGKDGHLVSRWESAIPFACSRKHFQHKIPHVALEVVVKTWVREGWRKVGWGKKNQKRNADSKRHKRP